MELASDFETWLSSHMKDMGSLPSFYNVELAKIMVTANSTALFMPGANLAQRLNLMSISPRLRTASNQPHALLTIPSFATVGHQKTMTVAIAEA